MANVFPNPDGRNKIEFNQDDWQKIKGLCQILCTGEEIADILEVSYDTLQRRVTETHGISFADFYKKMSANGKASLRRKQYKKAVEDGNTTMLIWLGKQYLGQKDQQEISSNNPIILKYNIDKDDETDKNESE